VSQFIPGLKARRILAPVYLNKSLSCNEIEDVAFYKTRYPQAHTSRISAGAKTTYHRVPDTYEVLEDCPNCGAKKKDIQDYYDGKYKKKLSH